MVSVTPNLHFGGCCERALELYARALGARVASVMYYAQACPADWTVNEGDGGLVYHSEFYIGSQRIFASDTNDMELNFGNAQSLVVAFGSAEEGIAAYEALSEGGQILYPMKQMSHGSRDSSVVDRFGIRWEILIME